MDTATKNECVDEWCWGWKKIGHWFFIMQVLRPHLIKLSVNHIHEHTHTSKCMTRLMDLHHGFNLRGLNNFCLVEHGYLTDK
jgi:hypothetical protein